MNLRRARVDDASALLDLWERSVRATHGFLGEADILALRPLVAAELASDSIEWWVAADALDAPIAFLGYTPGVIEGLFVDPPRRGQGAGTRLVSHAQQLAAGPLHVDVNEQNELGRGFYESLGFVVKGRSASDTGGRPYPILHMLRAAPAREPNRPAELRRSESDEPYSDFPRPSA